MSLLNNLFINGSNLVISDTSNTSINSVMNIISLGELANGQYLNNPSIKLKDRVGSLDKNNIEHLNN